MADNEQVLSVRPGETRVRIKHARTAKDGWTTAETTVESVGPAGSREQRAARRLEMRQAFVDAWQEAQYRNLNPMGEDMPDDLPEL